MWSKKRKRFYQRKPIRERWEEKVEKTYGCWLWKPSVGSHGYGALLIEKTPVYRSETAHRLSWIFHRGEIPPGMQVLHKCDVRRCVNPDHLFLGTQKQNIVDCIKKGRFPFIRGKLTPEQVMEIKTALASGEKCQDLAEKYNVTRRTISHIKNGTTWARINADS